VGEHDETLAIASRTVLAEEIMVDDILLESRGGF
jgi:hypothetical protein